MKLDIRFFNANGARTTYESAHHIEIKVGGIDAQQFWAGLSAAVHTQARSQLMADNAALRQLVRDQSAALADQQVALADLLGVIIEDALRRPRRGDKN